MLVKMLMEIDPPPDERTDGDDDGDNFPLPGDVSPAKQLHRSPRLIPPRFRLVAVESHPESLLMIFSSMKETIEPKMGIRGPPGGP